MGNAQKTATMMIPPNGRDLWTDIMQNPPKLPEGVTEGQFIAASYTIFEDGVSVMGGVAVGPASQGFNYALFMVFDSNYNQIGGWPIDTSDWEDFQVRSIEFSIDPNEDEPSYVLDVVEADS